MAAAWEESGKGGGGERGGREGGGGSYSWRECHLIVISASTDHIRNG